MNEPSGDRSAEHVNGKGIGNFRYLCLKLSLMCFAIRLVVPFQLDFTVASTSEIRGKVRRLLQNGKCLRVEGVVSSFSRKS